MELGLGLTKIIPYIIYFIGISVILVTLFYKIEIGIFFLVPLLPQQSLLDRLQDLPIGKDFIDILVFAILLRWFFNKATVAGQRKFVRTQFNLPVFLLVLWTLIGLWRGAMYLGYGSNPLTSFHLGDMRFITWKNFMTMPILYFAILNNIRNEKHIKILILLMALSTFAMGLHFRNNMQHTDMSHYRHDIRISGTFSYLSPNAVAVFFAQYSSMFLALMFFDKNKWRRWFYLGAGIFGLYSVMFSFSRGGYMAALAGILFIGLFKNRVLLICLVFFLLTWKVWVPNAVIERVEMSEGDRSIKERFNLWESGKQIIESNPIVGVGFATLSIKQIEDEIAGKSRKSLHNGYLQVCAELGIIGLFIFLYIYRLGFKAGRKLRHISEDPFLRGMGFGLMACIIAALAGNIGGSYWHFINVSGFYWVMQALVVRAVLDEEARKKAVTSPGFQETTVDGRGELQPITSS